MKRLTFWYSVPLALIQLLTYGGIEDRDVSSLRWVLFGGEPFAPKYLRRLMELWPQARFSNSYGPAEVNQKQRHGESGHQRQGDHGPGAGPTAFGARWATQLDPAGEASEEDEEAQHHHGAELHGRRRDSPG